jgi:RNA polymerase sigma-70 factor (ECF subfamily)
MTALEIGHDRSDRFEALYRAHGQSIAAYVRRRVVEHDVEDVIAQVFLVAWRRLAVIPPPPEDRLWLFGVARRMVADHRRSTVRRRRLSERLAEEARRPVGPVGAFDPTQLQIDRAMRSLRPGERQVLRLVLWDGASHTETAALLGCTASPSGGGELWRACKRPWTGWRPASPLAMWRVPSGTRPRAHSSPRFAARPVRRPERSSAPADSPRWPGCPTLCPVPARAPDSPAPAVVVRRPTSHRSWRPAVPFW